MARYGAYIALVVAALLLVGAVYAASEEKEAKGSDEAKEVEEKQDQDKYPLSWIKIDIEPIVNNDRLFKKYKTCLMADSTKGCPRDVTELRKIIPEILETTCAKCLPEHVEKVKEALEYICKKRRADFDEVLNARDPEGKTRAKFEAAFGTINC